MTDLTCLGSDWDFVESLLRFRSENDLTLFIVDANNLEPRQLAEILKYLMDVLFSVYEHAVVCGLFDEIGGLESVYLNKFDEVIGVALDIQESKEP